MSVDTYNITGGDFTDFVGPAYSVPMKVTGSITRSGAIPSSATDYDITPLVTSFTFFDGVQTITSANGVFYDISTGDAIPQFSTDANGNIVTARFNVAISYPAVLNGTFHAIAIDELKSAGYRDGTCIGITNDFCTTPAETEGYSSGTSEEGTTWVHISSPPPAGSTNPIPTMSGWAPKLLSMLLGITAFARRKRLF